ncbi:Chlorinase MJ1651 [Geodia barretti]|uniref:Chlorinase MJ1651 n=1 Tax=Geodia barretti TaxID=519541 RepID=A0AA35R949_GEOBA|nr:Chlorinase MJ1651 [Geodia barretti]
MAVNRPVITLTTDFGTRDPYVGAMKGVILSRCPQANIVDISHEISQAAISYRADSHTPHPTTTYVLASAATHFPPDAIHVAVVDPGVGSDRRSIAVHTPSGTFVGPDNGLISLAICEYIQTPAKPNDDIDGANLSGGTVVHIDRYGNLITNIPADSVPVGSAFEVAGQRIEGLSASYSEAVGKLLAIIGSEGTVEIAVGNGNAARTLNSTIGDRVAILTESP